MPLLIWLRYELLTVSVLVVKRGEGGEKSSTLQRAKTRQLRRLGKAHRSTLVSSESQEERLTTPKVPSFTPLFFFFTFILKKKKEIPTNT